MPSKQDSSDRLPWIETPLKYSPALSRAAGCEIYLKLENLQPGGSFKSRGVGNYLVAHLESLSNGAEVNGHNGSEATHAQSRTHFFSSSGGNAGLACVHAAVSLNTAATVVVPMTTTQYMISKIREAGAAEVIQKGDSWAEADAFLREVLIPEARSMGSIPVYVPPFDSPHIWTGNSTLVDEAVAQLQQFRGEADAAVRPDAFVCSVGGGGLFAGVMEGLARLNMPDVPVVAVETKGAESLAYSLERGELSALPKITSIATSLGARTVALRAFEYALQDNVKSVVLDDRDAKLGCVKLADDERILVEAACGVSIATCYNGKLKEVLPNLTKDSKVVLVCCGGTNISLDVIAKYRVSMENGH